MCAAVFSEWTLDADLPVTSLQVYVDCRTQEQEVDGLEAMRVWDRSKWELNSTYFKHETTLKKQLSAKHVGDTSTTRRQKKGDLC